MREGLLAGAGSEAERAGSAAAAVDPRGEAARNEGPWGEAHQAGPGVGPGFTTQQPQQPAYQSRLGSNPRRNPVLGQRRATDARLTNEGRVVLRWNGGRCLPICARITIGLIWTYCVVLSLLHVFAQGWLDGVLTRLEHHVK